MKRDELFWERVDAALDERRDPSQDERVLALVAERPERLDELLALRQRLAMVEGLCRPHKARRAAAAAVALVAAGVLVALLALDRARPKTHAANELRPSDGSCMLSFTASVVHETAQQRTTTYFDGACLVVRHESLEAPQVLEPAAPTRFVALVESFAITR